VKDTDLKRRFYPESNITGFTHVDGTVGFYSQVVAYTRPDHIVLEFGAGRGRILSDDPIEFRRNISDLRTRCAHLDGCDIDPVVLNNPYLDTARVIRESEALPYENERFDLIISRFVFEHVSEPDFTARELLRVLKPGGLIAATTPNKWGYIGLGARLVPNRFHVGALARIQPEREAEDIFPTVYKLNTRADLHSHFARNADIFVVRRAAEPAYHFGKPLIYRAIKWLNKHSPDSFLPVLDIYIRKRT
jgi:SAM-dependent methyltransferase